MDHDEVERTGSELAAAGQRVSARTSLLFGPTHEITARVVRALSLFRELTYLTRRAIPIAGERERSDVLSERESEVRRLYDALAVAAGRKRAARWVEADNEDTGEPDFNYFD